MTGLAEQQIISGAAQREESLNVQTLVDKHTKELKVSQRSYLSPPPLPPPHTDIWNIAPGDPRRDASLLRT